MNSNLSPKSDIWTFAKIQPEEMYSQVYGIENHGEGRERTDTGEIINDCSVGLNRILNMLAANANNPQRPLFDVYLINILTMARNCFDKHMSDKEWHIKINHDLEILKNYLTSYCGETAKNSAVVFYLPTYTLPEEFMRPLTGVRAELDIFAKRMKSMLPRQMTLISDGPLQMYVSVLGNSPFPHQQLARTVAKVSRAGRSAKVMLVSHIPLDFHLHRFIPQTYLLESYKAEFVNPKEFGYKVFKVSDVPFNQYTHLAFGDDVLIKPILQRKAKADAIDRAKMKRWRILSRGEQIEELVKCGILRPQLTTLKFY